MVAGTRRTAGATPKQDDGFTLIELLVAMGLGAVVLGAGVTIVSQVQRGYTSQLDSAAVQEEARYAVDWIAQELASAGSNPYGVSVSDCPTSGTDFLPLRLDPNQNGAHDDLRINADVGIPNGLLGGETAVCTESDEDVTISFDPSNGTITRFDHNVDLAPIPTTDDVITALQFTYLDINRVVTSDPSAIRFIQVAVTASGGARNAYTGNVETYTARAEVHIRETL